MTNRTVSRIDANRRHFQSRLFERYRLSVTDEDLRRIEREIEKYYRNRPKPNGSRAIVVRMWGETKVTIVYDTRLKCLVTALPNKAKRFDTTTKEV